MEQRNWNRFVPWFLTIACTLVLIVIGLFLIKNIEWYKESVFDSSIPDVKSAEYRFYAYHLHLSMIKRSIGLFSGFAVMLLGLGVAFFTLKDPTNIEAQGGGFKAKLITASPGIIAVLVGAYLIMSTIKSKDQFPTYKAIGAEKEVLDSSIRPPLPSEK
ncbi:hypothetical protein N9954_06785 [Maribacter sp.]|nr:hypothetical protein [Maribacter sp.]